ncbi:MAG: hypothetical protein Q4C03_07125, partial [bacterium]|nr:hypothetical protein [bacterium]
DYLDNRRLMNAVNRPLDGWKFDFIRNNIELLYRIDKRQSAVYNTRHRPLTPFNGIKELANKGEKYVLPYGIEKIDYSFKTIFVTEGIFDSCLLKNCLAYSNWILPYEMSKAVDVFRDAGYQIIHILDNFRLGDKGGVKGLETIVKSKDWLSQGDKVFSWDIYSDCDDLNEVAMKQKLDGIDPNIIIAHSWNEEEVRANYKDFIKVQAKVDEPEKGAKALPSTDHLTDDMEEFMAELDEETTKPVKSTPDAVLPKVEPSKKEQEQIPFFEDNEFDAVLDEFDREQREEERKRRDAMRKWEHKQQDELAEMAKSMFAMYNPTPAISHDTGIWDVPPRKLLK